MFIALLRWFLAEVNLEDSTTFLDVDRFRRVCLTSAVQYDVWMNITAGVRIEKTQSPMEKVVADVLMRLQRP